MWVGTGNHGLFRQNAPNGDFRNYTFQHNEPLSIASNDISAVFCDHDGTVWVAPTGGGLSRFLPDKDGFQQFETSVLPIQEQQVYFITEDNGHNLWVGMETCMLRIGADRDGNNVQVLRGKDLVRAQKPRNAAIVTTDGELFAGRFNLLEHFYPERITIRHDTSPVYVTSITLPYRTDDEEKT